MIITLFGGASSGKSAIAENIAVKFGGKMAYVATMKDDGREAQLKIQLHKTARQGKGFETIEKYNDIKADDFQNFDTILIECMSNWLANEMFMGGDVRNIFRFIQEISNTKKNIIIVTNNIFGEGDIFDKNIGDYMKTLGELNIDLGRVSDIFLEIVVGIAFCIKGEDIYKNYL